MSSNFIFHDLLRQGLLLLLPLLGLKCVGGQVKHSVDYHCEVGEVN